MSWLGATRTRLRLLFARDEAESRVDEEIRLHLEMETDRLIREEGLDPHEARRRALVSFGGVDRTKESMRDGRGLAWISGLKLDVKLGARMLLKYPVLTTASVLALAVAVALAASWFSFMSNIVRPQLPLPDAHRIVSVHNRDVEAASPQLRSLHDFEMWREEARTIQDLGAASPMSYTVSTEDERIGSIEGVRTTPELFRVAPIQPLLGRTLIPDDYRPGAEPVVVIGESVWRRLYDSDPGALGQTLRMGSQIATVVGVMPEGFGFPVNEEAWVPLREQAVDYDRLEGPAISMFGLLAPGYSLGEARAELAVLGQRTAAEHPVTHEHIMPEVRLYARGSDMAGPATFMNAPFLFFLLVVSANVATLLFARTATRESEIALRSALGASRRRILLQLVAEALVLTLVASALGLAVAHYGMLWGMDLFWDVQQSRPPFWFVSGLAPSAILYGILLAVIGALVIGGIPGLRATRRQLRSQLSQPGAGGSAMKFGTVATGVIIVQVALCVAFIPYAIMEGQGSLDSSETSDFPAENFLSARVAHADAGGSAGPGGAGVERGTAEVFEEVHRRLAAEPGVLAATRLSWMPGINHGTAPLQIEGDTGSIDWVRALDMDLNAFEVLEARVTSGRAFRTEDTTGEQRVAIVDEEWASEMFSGQSPIGRRIRYAGQGSQEPGEWQEIVGVVSGMDRAAGPGSDVAIFHPLRPGEVGGPRSPGGSGGLHFYLRTDGPPEAILPRIQSLITSVDSDLSISNLMPLDDAWRPIERSQVFFTVALAVISGIILLFAMIGIYALMSFTVAQRAREIGIRAALGADPRRIVVAIFSRALFQIGAGVVLGALLISLAVAGDPEGIRTVAGVALAMVAVGLLGCAIPARRALRIHPTEALRAE